MVLELQLRANLAVEFPRPPHVLLFFDDDHITLAEREVVVLLCQPRVDRLYQRSTRCVLTLLYMSIAQFNSHNNVLKTPLLVLLQVIVLLVLIWLL